MDFSDESYVRLYVRDTKTWLRLGFEGQCTLMFLLRKLDRSGVLDDIDQPAADVALLAGVPLAIVEVGLPRLLEAGVFVLRGAKLVMPNYVAAQNARQTDRLRKLESRARRAAGDGQSVTFRDQMSPAVTSGHPASPMVTPILSYPSLADPRSPLTPQGVTAPAEPTRFPESPAETPGASRFAPKDFEPNDTHRMRCAELRLPLADLVRAFKLHEFARPFSDWDRRFGAWIEKEKLNRETEAAKGPRLRQDAPGSISTSNPYAWAPTAEHVAYGAANGLDVRKAADEYRQGTRLSKLGTLDANADFMGRLRVWSAIGKFIADGPPPKRPIRDGPKAAA